MVDAWTSAMASSRSGVLVAVRPTSSWPFAPRRTPLRVARSSCQARCARLGIWGVGDGCRIPVHAGVDDCRTARPGHQAVRRVRACDPPGRQFHPCFGSAHHLTVFDVWDCADEFQAFGMTLMPSLAEEQIEMAPAEPLEIHRLIEGGDASVLRKAVAELRNTAFSNAPSRSMAAARRNPATSSPPHGSPRCAATNAGRTSPTPTATAG